MTEPTDHLADGHRHTPEFTEKVRRNQQKLASQLQPQYDFIVCAAATMWC